MQTDSPAQWMRDACMARNIASASGDQADLWRAAFSKADKVREWLEAEGVDLRTLRSVIG